MKHSKLPNSIPIRTTLVAVALLIGVFAPRSSEGAEPRATPRKQQTRAAYRAELDALMKEHKVACKISLDCDAYPLGVKPCGGPTEFLVMSKATKMKMDAALTDLTKTINEMDTVASEGMMGTCEAVQKPDVACSAGSCVTSKAK